MALNNDRVVVRQLRTLFSVGTIRELTDGQLLERFATTRGEAAELAFAVLLERHGPMVLRVCRGVLRADSQDTQDAFQATFLVLVKKARGLWVRDSLGPWLHQVAYRTAACARSAAARRRRHEQQAAAAAARESHSEPDDELGRVLHEEIEGLPEQFRSPLVLCDLEGSSYEQAARHLGWPVGTVKSRHSRGRLRLRDRLIRRGLAPASALIAATPKPGSAGALVPPALLDSTTRAAIQLALVRTFVAGSVASLAQGVLRSMITTQWLKAASILLVLGATASTVDFLAWRGNAGVEPQTEGTVQVAPNPKGERFVVADKAGKSAVTLDRRKGLLESAESEDVFSEAGGTTIVSILPEGTKVHKGELVCVLDSSRFEDDLKKQRLAATEAQAAYRNAQRSREIAEIAVTEYADAKFQSELTTLKAALAVAESAVQKAEARLKRTQEAQRWMKAVLAPKSVTATPEEILAKLDVEDRLDAAEQAVLSEKLNLEQARSKQASLEKYTREKTTKELQSTAETARSDEARQQFTYEGEKDKVAKLERQISACKLVSPSDGIVILANDPNYGGRPVLMSKGGIASPQQKLFSIIPTVGKMRVNIQVPEAIFGRVKQGLPVRIRVDAFADEVLTGLVESINPVPEMIHSGIVHSARVAIEKPLPGLRPGMSADVEILRPAD